MLDDVPLNAADGIAFAAEALVEMRLVEHKGADGAVDGLRISAIRSASSAAGLHLKNGDVAHASRSGARDWTAITSVAGFGAFAETLARPPAPVELLVTRRGTLTLLRFTAAD